MRYLIMDGRARINADDALVLDTCETIEEAREVASDYGDAVIVDSETMQVID